MPRRIEPVEAKHLDSIPEVANPLPEVATIDPKMLVFPPLVLSGMDADDIESELWWRWGDGRNSSFADVVIDNLGPLETEGLIGLLPMNDGWLVSTTGGHWWLLILDPDVNGPGVGRWQVYDPADL